MSNEVVHTFVWRMFQLQRATGASIDEARSKILAQRPAHIPEGTELLYVCSRGPRDQIAQASLSRGENAMSDHDVYIWNWVRHLTGNARLQALSNQADARDWGVMSERRQHILWSDAFDPACSPAVFFHPELCFP
jgi:hypothetical protein